MVAPLGPEEVPLILQPRKWSLLFFSRGLVGLGKPIHRLVVGEGGMKPGLPEVNFANSH